MILNGLFTDACYHDGREYTKGDKFIRKDCFAKCTCNGADKITCVDLCPNSKVLCGDDEVPELETVTFPDSHCACREWVCRKASKYWVAIISCTANFQVTHFF